MRGPERIRMNTQRDILDELSVSRKVVVAGEEVTPRFLVYTPSGNHLMLMPLPSDLGERLESFRLARLFMVWKAATGFILSTEIKIPRSITATLVTRDEVRGASQWISGNPVKFAEPVWYGSEQVDDEVIDVLPARSVEVTAEEIKIILNFEQGRGPELTWFKAGDADE